MSNVTIPGYRHHFVDEFNEENEHQNVKKTKGRLKISIEVSFVFTPQFFNCSVHTI